MGSDTLKLIFTLGITAVIIIAGGAALLFLPDVDSDTKLFVSGAIGAAIAWLYNAESATRATRAAQSSAEIGGTISTVRPFGSRNTASNSLTISALSLVHHILANPLAGAAGGEREEDAAD